MRTENDSGQELSLEIGMRNIVHLGYMAMGQNPVPLVNIPIPTKIGSKMGGEFIYPKMRSHWF